MSYENIQDHFFFNSDIIFWYLFAKTFTSAASSQRFSSLNFFGVLYFFQHTKRPVLDVYWKFCFYSETKYMYICFAYSLIFLSTTSETYSHQIYVRDNSILVIFCFVSDFFVFPNSKMFNVSFTNAWISFDILKYFFPVHFLNETDRNNILLNNMYSWNILDQFDNSISFSHSCNIFNIIT